MVKTRIGIVGARSYTARELIGRLISHPHAEITCLMVRTDEPIELAAVHPALRGRCEIPLSPIDEKCLTEECDLVFLCMPHGPAAECAGRLLEAGIRVVDLSADFRFRDVAVYERAYGQPHPATHLLDEAVYGLPELWRDQIPPARIVGNPGCYVTAVLMALAPLARAFPKAIPTTGVVADCKSGVSGAGRTLSETAHFSEANESMMPYKVAKHRHGPEIDTQISTWANRPHHITFVPHLTPMDRGICATVHVPWADGALPALGEIHGAYREFCEPEPFLRPLPLGGTVNTKSVAHSNFVDLALAADPEANLLIVMSAIDNLVKGASGQAIQNMNLMIGCNETTALL